MFKHKLLNCVLSTIAFSMLSFSCGNSTNSGNNNENTEQEFKEDNQHSKVQVKGKSIGDISMDDAIKAYGKIYEEWYEAGLKRYAKAWETGKLTINGYTMPLYWRYDSNITPDDGRALFISLHGGGGTAAEVNDQQWENQKVLYNPKESDVYLCPRAITNTWDLHFTEQADQFYEAIIYMAIVYMDVNPNKVYLMGYSAGGDGVWRLATRHSDMWAAASMMAGHPGDVSLVNLRNTPFMIWCGAEDEAYNRNIECAKRIDEMEALHKADPSGYIYSGNIIKNAGHWMNNVDHAAIDWMYQYTRSPYPNRIVWQQEELTFTRFYWLKVPENEAQRGKRVIANYDEDNNSITIQECDYKHLTILLNDFMLDLDKPIVVNYQGKEIFNGKVSRSKELIKQTLFERNDPEFCFYGEINISL